jgi:hypothetical protein
MHALKRYRDQAQGLPDLLDWAALIDSGVVQGKNGSLMAGYFTGATTWRVPPRPSAMC